LSGNRSERISTSSSQITGDKGIYGQIRGNIYFFEPDQRGNGYMGAGSEGLKPLTRQWKGDIEMFRADER
jgi:hypothetical protein